MSGSKYETMAKAIEKKIEELDKGANDLVKQKQLEQKLKRIDNETERKIKQRKATPVDSEDVKREAECDYNLCISQIENKITNDINQATLQLENLEINYNRQKKELEQKLKQIEESCNLYRNRETLNAKNNLNRKLSSLKNKDEILEIDIKNIKEKAEVEKESIQAELDNVTMVNESKSAKMEAIDRLYNDIKEISLSLGDAKK